MSKQKSQTIFVCQSCGFTSARWLGKCVSCSSWNSFVEEKYTKTSSKPKKSSSTTTLLSDIKSSNDSRISINNDELNRVLGGGLVLGSIILIGGDPGIGKSTLAIQMLNSIENERNDEIKLLYVSGEESPEQIKIRAERVGADSNSLYILSETNIENIKNEISKYNPLVVVIDSIQTMFTDDFNSAAGSVSQIRECTLKLMDQAKSKNFSVLLIGHVTKEGTIAGPKVLEHLVDTVLYFEGGKDHPYRILRAVKNRFGSTNEIGIFEMLSNGLVEVKNPSEIFLSERSANSSGSVVIPSLEGTRPILIEVQALVSPCNFGVPRRTTIGLDQNRVSLLVAVLEKKAGLQILGQDIFMNIPGGVKIDEPATDLAVCISLVSSLQNKPIDPYTIIFGEVGLAGEIRAVSQTELRLKEAKNLGFKTCVLPKKNLDRLKQSNKSISLIGVESLNDAIDKLL